MIDPELLASEPIGFHDGIPLFSKPTEYTDNYERISGDHLASLKKEGTNPFIPEDLWVEFERSTIELVQKYARPGDRILDAGVGLGRLLSHFPTLKRYGVDISLGYLEIARTKGIAVGYALMEELPFKPATFDLVVCTDVLEHVIDLNRCCANILNVLRPGGVLIVRVPCREDLSQYLAPDYPYRYVHLRAFDEFSLRLLFERVFDCRVQEMTIAGYQLIPTKLKPHVPSPRWYQTIERNLTRLHRLHPGLYNDFVRRLYHPIVMNAVVIKP